MVSYIKSFIDSSKYQIDKFQKMISHQMDLEFNYLFIISFQMETILLKPINDSLKIKIKNNLFIPLLLIFGVMKEYFS